MIAKVGNNRLNSSLQEEILKHIAITRDAGYDTLTRDVKKGRTTIIQSLNTLIDTHYVNKQKIKTDDIRNINTIFKPTKKGLLYSIALLDVSFDSIMKSHTEENDLVQYNEFIKKIVDKSMRNEFNKNTALAFINSDIFDEKGEMKITKSEDLFNYGFMFALTGLARKKSPEAELYFKRLDIDSLRKILSPEELKEVQEYYSRIRSYVGDTYNAIRKELSNEQ